MPVRYVGSYGIKSFLTSSYFVVIAVLLSFCTKLTLIFFLLLFADFYLVVKISQTNIAICTDYFTKCFDLTR